MKFIFLSIFTILFTLHVVVNSSTSKAEQIRSTNLPACRACKILVESFRKGLLKTANGKFEGGDADWEEKKLGSYATSEIRLIEIQEHLCKDIEEGRNQCFSLAEQHDSLLEDWWFKYQTEHPDLLEWLCVRSIKSCCLDNQFGPECSPCPGYPDNVCSKNGKCKGAGTRKGNGSCVCDTGYLGDNCLECADSYYVSYKDDSKLLCSKCHQACEGSCKEAGNKGCVKCATGWLMEPERGCLDINECAFEKPTCLNSQFCVNNEGSYKCLDCDRACEGCSGDGPDMCDQCAEGYELNNNVCTDSSVGPRASYVTFARYMTYVGLCVATCIILQKNVTVAAILGLNIALYISVSEYMLSTGTGLNKPDSIIDSDSLLQAIR